MIIRNCGWDKGWLMGHLRNNIIFSLVVKIKINNFLLIALEKLIWI